MSDAPETEVDSEIVTLDCEDSCCAVYVRNREGKEIHGDLVSADFARRLVSERDEARKPGWYQTCLKLAVKLGPITKSPGIEGAVDEVLSELSTLRAQVAELREALETYDGTDSSDWWRQKLRALLKKTKP